MSDLAVSPYAPGSPEDQQYNRGAFRGFALPLTNMPAGALSQLLPSPEAPGAEKAIPGAVSGAYSSADAAQALFRHYVMGTPEKDIGHLPGGEEAARLSQGSSELAHKIIPGMQPDDSKAENFAAGVGDTVGAMSVGLPASIASKLPGAARILSSAVLPGPKAVVPALAISGGLQAALSNDAQAQPTDNGKQAPAPGSDRPVSNPYFDTPINGKDDDYFTTPIPQAQTPNAKAGADSGYFTTPIAPEPKLNEFGDPVAVTQAEQDPTGITWKHVLFGLVAGAAVMAGGRKALSAIDDIKQAKFFADSDVINQAAAQNKGVVAGEVPLPGSAGSRTTAIRQNVQDRMALPTEYLRSTADTPLMADQLRAKASDITDTQAQLHRYQQAAISGDMHGQAMPSITDWHRDAAALTPAQRDIFNTGMHYGNEIDARRASANLLGQPGNLNDATNVRFPEKDIAELQQGLNTALADPQVKALMDTAKMQTDAMADMLVRQGQMSAADAGAMKNAHRYYVPTGDIDHVIGDPLGERNLTPYSGSSALPDVFEMRDMHDYSLFKRIDRDNFRAMIYDRAMDFQSKPDPVSGIKPAPLLQDSKNPLTGAWVKKDDGSSISFRQNGEIKHVVVNNRQMLDALRGSPAQSGATITGMNKLRQLSQSTMTGPLSILFGHVFPVINAARTAGEASVLRPAGMYGSLFDRLAQRATGGRLALRGDPISPYLGTAYRMVADPSAVVTKAIGDIFDSRATNPINTRARALIGDQAVDAMAQRLQAVYHSSNHAAMAERGLIGSAGATAQDVRTNANDFLSRGNPQVMPSYNMVPELFQANRISGRPTYVRLRNLFDELRGTIGDAAHSNLFALNKDNPNLTPHQLNFEIRNITGNPATHGAGSLAGSYGKAVPFGNIAIQEAARVARSMNEAPLATVMGWMAHYGTLAAASAYTAMLAGPDAVRHLFDLTTDHRRSNEAAFYVPGQPTNPIRLPLQIEMRGPYNLAVQMFHDYLSLPSHQDNPDWAGRVQDVMHDFFGKHVWQSTVNGTAAGVSGGIPPVLPVGVGPAATLLTGKTADPNVYDAYTHRDQPINKMFSYDITGENTARVPGQAAGKVDPVTHTVSGSIIQHIISDIFAVAGTSMMNTITQGKNIMDHNGTIGDFLHNVGQDYKMRAIESVPGASTLWGQDEKLTANTPLQQRVEQIMDVIRPLTSWKNDAKAFGYTRAKGGMPLIEPGQQNVPTDPTMMGLYATAGKYAELLETKPGSPLKEVQDLRKEIASLDRSPLDPATVRSMKNNLIMQMQDKYANVMAYIHEMNGQLSDIAHAHVDVRKIDWKKGPEQFTTQAQ